MILNVKMTIRFIEHLLDPRRIVFLCIELSQNLYELGTTMLSILQVSLREVKYVIQDLKTLKRWTNIHT